mgnify:CR=1 FL=1|tara:strand:- start:352 stop:465 length:114 start_codon:yes stop_codon:yes gene_type:complete
MLGMTVQDLEKKMTLSEFTGWIAYLNEKKRQVENGKY